MELTVWARLSNSVEYDHSKARPDRLYFRSCVQEIHHLFFLLHVYTNSCPQTGCQNCIQQQHQPGGTEAVLAGASEWTAVATSAAVPGGTAASTSARKNRSISVSAAALLVVAQNGRQQQQQLRRQEGQQHQHQPGRIAASAPAQQQCWLWHQNGRHLQRLLWRQEGQPPQRRLDSSILSVGCGGGMDSSRSVGCGARRDSNISVGAAVCGARRYISISSVGCGGRMDSSRIVGCGTRRDSNISVTATLASTQQCAALGGTAASASAQQCWMWRQNGQQQQCQPGGTVVAVSNRENSSIASSHIVMKSNLVWILMRLCRTFITR